MTDLNDLNDTTQNAQNARIGILMLDSRFPRIPGDTGNPATWPFPVEIRVVPGATPAKVVAPDDPGLLAPFIAAGQALVAGGARALTTTCGFLALYQDALAAAVGVPVVASSLSQVAMVNRTLPKDRPAGVLTIAASALGAAHLRAAGAPEITPIGSTEGGQTFTRAILTDAPTLDVPRARQDNVEAALDLQARHPEIGALVLECTNMVPYAPDIARATGLPVYSLYTLVHWLHQGLSPPAFAAAP